MEAFGDRIYVTETCLVNGAEPHVSGIYRFDLEELSADKPVELKPDGADPHLVAKFTTEAADWRAGVGANGLAISPKGDLYVCNFGEASILTAPLNDDGFLAEPLKVLVKGNGIGKHRRHEVCCRMGQVGRGRFLRQRPAHRECQRSAA